MTGEVIELASHLVKSPTRWKVLRLVLGVIGVLLLNIVGRFIRIAGSAPFSMIEKRDLGLIGKELLVFLAIVSVPLTGHRGVADLAA